MIILLLFLFILNIIKRILKTIPTAQWYFFFSLKTKDYVLIHEHRWSYFIFCSMYVYLFILKLCVKSSLYLKNEINISIFKCIVVYTE